MKLLDAFKTEKFYVQGAAGLPIYGTSTGESAVSMQEDLGFSYGYVPQNYKQGYLEVYYPEDKLDEIWRIVESELEKDPMYLVGVKRRYQQKMQDGMDYLEGLDQVDLSAITDKELLQTFGRCIDIQTSTVGVAHILEAVGIGLDEKFKAHLHKLVSDAKAFNQAYAALTEPSQPSFVYQEQQDLESLKPLTGQALDQALEKHIAKYFYILNGYSGPRALTKEQCLDRLNHPEPKASTSSFKKSGLDLELDARIRQLIGYIDYSIVWQDERKRNILIGITYLGRLVTEIARRSGIPYEQVVLMTSKEGRGLSSLNDIGRLEPPLAARESGMMYTPTHEGEEILVGEDYVQCLKAYTDRQGKKEEELDAIYGSVANTGTAIGPVAVCKDLASIDKVKQGDILVASMTRPEYMAAIKKAAAIVTDEGGITCHAAIVARELGIPCIIGTKIATQTLKDGDMVEVRANHGYIKLIDNA